MLPHKYQDMLRQLPSNASEGEVRETIERIVTHGDPADDTKLTRYSNLKKCLRSLNPEWVTFLDVPRKLIDSVKQARTDRLDNRYNIEIIPAVIEMILSFRKSEEPAHRVAFLQLVSGRRISEIFAAKFRKHGDEVCSRSLSKKRTDKLFIFPLLPIITSEEFIREVQALRRMASHMSLDALTRSVNRRLKDVQQNLHSHMMRGFYANLMWMISGQRRMKTAYIKKVLCLESQEVAINYSAYTLPRYLPTSLVMDSAEP